MSQKQATRKITIIARYYIKKSGIANSGVHYTAGSVVFLVRNDKGVEYLTTIRPNGVHSCTCPHVITKKSPACYHILDCAALESVREATAKKALAAMTLTQEVEAIVIEAEKELAATPARELAPLNGNRAFSLLRR